MISPLSRTMMLAAFAAVDKRCAIINVVLSLEPIMEPPVRFKDNAAKYGFKKEDAIVFKVGEINSLENILSD